jgi:type III secretory pathway lipoprotein EscJ
MDMSRHLLNALLVVLSVLAGGCTDGLPELVRVPDQGAAISILVELSDAGIDGGIVEPIEDRRSTSSVIRIPEARLAAARKLLRTLELPRPESSGFDELLGASSLIPTATEERARLMHALAGEIEQTIELIDGVVAARVHLVLPNEERLTAPGESKQPSAVVLVKYREDSPPKLTGDDGRDPEARQSQPWQSHLKDLVDSAMKGFTDTQAEAEVVVRATPVQFDRRAEAGGEDVDGLSPASVSGDTKGPFGIDRMQLLTWGSGLLIVSTVLFFLLWMNERLRPQVAILGLLRRSDD